MKPLRTTAFLATTDADRAKAFYVAALGAEFIDDTPFSLLLRVGGMPLRIQKVETVHAPPYTALGWQTDDIESTVETAASRGVIFERFEGIDQDAAGIWTAPDGAKVAWFRDPDGQLLSLDQQP